LTPSSFFFWVNDVKDLYTADSKYYKNGTWSGSDTTVLNAIAVDKVIADWGKIEAGFNQK
jgi:hypothetical protein